MHGGLKIYRGGPSAARSYVEVDRSRADDYYLAEGTGLAARLVATANRVAEKPAMDGPTYERWVAGHDFETNQPKGRLRTDDQAVRFVEVTVNGPRHGPWLRLCIPASPRHMTPPSIAPPSRSFAGWPSTRLLESARGGGRCRCRSRRARPPSYATTPRAPATPTDTSTSRSTPGYGRPDGRAAAHGRGP